MNAAENCIARERCAVAVFLSVSVLRVERWYEEMARRPDVR
jgi:hypothetical protein